MTGLRLSNQAIRRSTTGRRKEQYHNNQRSSSHRRPWQSKKDFQGKTQKVPDKVGELKSETEKMGKLTSIEAFSAWKGDDNQ